jgi:hypothetical protein
MKVNITLRLDGALLRDIQVLAEEEGTSVGAFVTAHLRQIVGQRKVHGKIYERARGRALSRLREGLDLRWKPARSRDELYGR